jgi:hypothetical protein
MPHTLRLILKRSKALAVDTTVLTKIKKLLALSTSSNPNEAALAASKAQELLMQHNLTMSQVEMHGESSYGQEFVQTGSRFWKRSLLTVIARNNFCEVIYEAQIKSAALIGEKHNQEVVTYLYGYLVSQLEPMAMTAYRLSDTTMHAKTWLDSFYMGAINAINARLKAQKAEMIAESNACKSLVVIKDAELQEALRKFYPDIKAEPKKRVKSLGGYREGVEAGKRVALNKAIE